MQGVSSDYSRIENLAVDTTMLSATDVVIFVGLGPYFIDANANGVFDDGEQNPDRIGVTGGSAGGHLSFTAPGGIGANVGGAAKAADEVADAAVDKAQEIKGGVA